MGQVGGGVKVDLSVGSIRNWERRAGVAKPGFLPICFIRCLVPKTGVGSLRVAELKPAFESWRISLPVSNSWR